MTEKIPSVRERAETEHEARCPRSHEWGGWSISCVRAVDARVLEIIRESVHVPGKGFVAR